MARTRSKVIGKHTPGPWEVSKDDPCRVCVGLGVVVDEDQGDDVCIVQTDTDHYCDQTPGACEANANLIAAAPDLLYVCKWIQKHLTRFEREGQGLTAWDLDALNLTSKAIAKATA